MGYLYQRGRVWWVEYYANGQAQDWGFEAEIRAMLLETAEEGRDP